MTDKITIERQTLARAIAALEYAYSEDDEMVQESIKYLRAALRAEQPVAAQQAEPQEPVAWKHDCAGLCTNDVELWIDACPHCGKPRAAPSAPAAVPPGYVLVPIEPTPKMGAAGEFALVEASGSDFDPTREEIIATYRAMIAAVGEKP